MSRSKIKKFSELATFTNYLNGEVPMKGKWNVHYFRNENPLVLELGCGKGEYTNHLAHVFPDRNFTGIDLKGARLWAAAKASQNIQLSNVAFLQINIDKLTDHFDREEVDEIWIPFPDPYPKPSKWKKRLISSWYLNKYKQVLKKEGMIHFKTDNLALYHFALDTINKEDHDIVMHTDDLYNSAIQNEYNSIPTWFEHIFREKGESIKYICFQLNNTQKAFPSATEDTESLTL